jgi:hypothetical protein
VCEYECISNRQTGGRGERDEDLLRINTKPRPIRLHEPPQYILRRFIDIRTRSILREVLFKRHLHVMHPVSKTMKIYRSLVAWRRTLGSLLLNTSILFRKRMIDVRRNHRELITLSKRTSDSAIRFCRGSQVIWFNIGIMQAKKIDRREGSESRQRK